MSSITISQAAQAHFKKLLANQSEGTQIRIFVMHPGTMNAECGVSYCPEDTVEEKDHAIEYNGFLVYVDEESLPFLDEAMIDFVSDEMGSQLTLKAPNAKLKKVAEDAPLIERVNYFMATEVNPNLASHGGHVNVVEITDENDVILQFGGGCNGCSMVDVTLKEGIEKQLLAQFPEVKSVKDLTDHQSGEHSYY